MTGREAAAEALGPFLRDFAQKAIDAAPTAVALTATGLAATALPDLLAAIERGDIPGVGVLPESEVGRCGDSPVAYPNARMTYCRLPHGHDGWHKGDDGSEWSHADREPVLCTAYYTDGPHASVDAETLLAPTDNGGAYLPICQPCIDGEGAECHTPGCALWMHDVPSDGLNGDMALSSGVTLAADREPDGLWAKVEALAQRWAETPGAYADHGSVLCLAWSTAVAELRTLLAHPATDQEEADRG